MLRNAVERNAGSIGQCFCGLIGDLKLMRLDCETEFLTRATLGRAWRLERLSSLTLSLSRLTQECKSVQTFARRRRRIVPLQRSPINGPQILSDRLERSHRLSFSLSLRNGLGRASSSWLHVSDRTAACLTKPAGLRCVGRRRRLRLSLRALSFSLDRTNLPLNELVHLDSSGGGGHNKNSNRSKRISLPTCDCFE